MYRSSPLRSALNMCASAKECHHPHPIPPHPIPCDVCAGECGWKEWCKIFSGVYLWLQSVCAGDSGKWLCAHVTPVCVRGWLWVEKNDAKLCLCVLVTPECVRGWPPDLSRCNVSFREGKPSKQQSKFCSQGHVWPLRDCTAPLEQRSASQYQRRWWNCYWFGLSLSWNLDLLTWFAFFVHVVSLAWSIFCETVIYCRPSLTK